MFNVLLDITLYKATSPIMQSINIELICLILNINVLLRRKMYEYVRKAHTLKREPLRSQFRLSH